MKPTSIRTLFFSPTGTSKKIASAIAEGVIQCAAKDAGSQAGTDSNTQSAAVAGCDGTAPQVQATDLTHAAAEAVTMPAEAVALFAVPVYGGRVAPAALERMRELRGDRTPAVLVAVYGNRAFGAAVRQLAEFLCERGFVPVAAAAFVGEHSYSTPRNPIAEGRPDACDLADAAAFGKGIYRKLVSGGIVPVDAAKLREPRTPLLPQLRFIRFVLGYRRCQKSNPVILLPTGDAARCTQCGRCVALCPTQAIPRGDELHTDAARCIRCCACVKGCPFDARSFDTPFAEALARNFKRRKPPVTLL